MTNRIFALALALLFTLATVASASAKTPAPADWPAVQTLSPGEKVRVSTKDGDRLKGSFESASDTEINFTHEGHRMTLRRDNVKSVEVGHKNRWKGALLGGGIGTGLGAAGGGYVVARSDHWGGDPLPAGMLVGAGVGAAVGAAVGFQTDYDTVYESF
jgi:hypothetical protein